MELLKLKNDVIDLTLEVGDFIRKEGQAFDRTHIEQKSSFNNLVSYVDKEAERRLVAALSRMFPAAGFITEEGTVEQSSKQEYNWIIDPLDGTTNFLHGLPLYGISIGLTKGTETVLGIVYHIGTGECFHAITGDDAFCNDRKISVSKISLLSESLLATGFPYYHLDKRDQYLDIIKDFLATSHGIRRLGSAAIDLAYVACGKLEGFFEYNLNAWDVAAGTLIVKQAGGHVTDFTNGNNFIFGGQLCASNSAIHQEMLATIQKRWQ
jgi:myo-inositol-1(or 4)-monophosphatase